MRRALHRAADRDRPEPSEAGGFDAGELERVGGAGGGGDSAALSWRFRSARAKEKTTAASARRASPSAAADAFDGAALVRLALFDEELGSRRMPRARADARRWSRAPRRASRPRRVLDALDASGGHGWRGRPGVRRRRATSNSRGSPRSRRRCCSRTSAWRPAEPPGPASGRRAVSAPSPRRSAAWTQSTRARAAARGALRDAGVGDDASETRAPPTLTLAAEMPAATPGRVTGEIPRPLQPRLGTGAAGLDAALDAVSDRVATVRFPDGPLAGFAPYDWDEGTGAQVWEVDDGCCARETASSPDDVSVDGARVGRDDVVLRDVVRGYRRRAFDAPRPIEVTFQSKAPNVERLYAVEMRAEHAAGGLQTKKTESSAAESAAEFRAGRRVGRGNGVARGARDGFRGRRGSGTPRTTTSSRRSSCAT